MNELGLKLNNLNSLGADTANEMTRERLPALLPLMNPNYPNQQNNKNMKYLLLLPALLFAAVACDKKTEIQVTPRKSVVIETPTNASLWWKGNWNMAQGKLKQQYADLSDDDLLYAEGKEEELYGRLQKKLGKSRNEIEKLLNDLK